MTGQDTFSRLGREVAPSRKAQFPARYLLSFSDEITGRAVMDREAIKALLERAYEARKAEDIEGILAVFHPAGTFALAGSKDAFAAAGAAQGHQELRATLTGLIANFQFVQRDILCTLIDNDRAAVHSRVKLRFVPKDKTITTELVDLFKFQDGKIVELVEFVDSALVNNLMR